MLLLWLIRLEAVPHQRRSEQPKCMKRVIPSVVVFIFVWSAAAYELTDNPAFCAGFLSKHSDLHAAMMRTHEAAILRAFSTKGPKDSTDGRGFNEWLQEGSDAAEDKTDPAYQDTFVACRTLIERIAD